MVLLSSSIPLCKSAHLCLSVWNEDCLVFHAFFCHLFVLKTFITVVQIRWWSLISCASKSFFRNITTSRVPLLVLVQLNRSSSPPQFLYFNAFAKYEMHFTTIHQNGQKQCFFKSFFLFLVYHFFWTFYTLQPFFGFIAQHRSPIWHLKNLIRSVE